MKRENQMKQPKLLFLPLIITVVTVLLLCAAPASAVELAAGTPVTNEETGVITVPIILKNDLGDFVGFSAKVENSIPGADITIGSERPISGATYIVNSEDGQTEQYVNAMFYDAEKSLSGISDAEITLFTLDIRLTDSSVTNLPLDITLRELLSASTGSISLDTVKQIDLSGLRLTDTVTADVTSVGKADDPVVYVPPTPVVPEQTPVPSQTEVPSQPDVPQQQPTANPTAKPAGTQSSPGFGMVPGILGLLFGAGIIRKQLGRR